MMLVIKNKLNNEKYDLVIFCSTAEIDKHWNTATWAIQLHYTQATSRCEFQDV